MPHAVNLVVPLQAKVRASHRRTTGSLHVVRLHSSHGLSVLRRPAHHRFSSEARNARVCSAAVSSLKRSLNTKDKRQCVSLALRSTAAPGRWFGAGTGFARAGGFGALGHQGQLQFGASRKGVRSVAPRWFGSRTARGAGAVAHAAEPMLMVLGRVVPSSGRPNRAVEGTHNGGARLLASSPSAAPLSAPHLQR